MGQKADHSGGLKVARMEARSEDQKAVRMEVPTEGHSVDQTGGRKEDRSEGLMAVQTEDRLVGRMEAQMGGLMAVQTEDRSVDLKVAPTEVLMEAHLVDPQGLLEVPAVLHRFAQPVLVQARQSVLRALEVLGLEVVFA